MRDSRVSEEANERFLDVMEDYFAQPYEALQQDLRPEVHYQGEHGRPSCEAGRGTEWTSS